MSADRDARQPRPLFGLAAEFDSPEAIVEAARSLHALGYTRAEAFTPMPIEGLAESLGSRRTYIAPIVGIAAAIGGASGYLMQWFANVSHYPQNVGGKPLNSWPMFMPITFELSILFAGVAGLLGMLAMNRLPTLFHPMFKLDGFDRASRDRFFLCIEARDAHFDLERTRAALEATHPLSVLEVQR